MRKQDLRSVIQPEFQDLVNTHLWPVHHVFEGVKNRSKCEKYGFMVCISPEVHALCDENTLGGPALYYKQLCQSYFEANIGTRERFIQEFGRSYLEESCAKNGEKSRDLQACS
jgi:hypothetical protein